MKKAVRYAGVWMALVLLGWLTAVAAQRELDVAGKVYDLDGGGQYVITEESAWAETGVENTYGTFYLRGAMKQTGEISGVPVYRVEEGTLELHYDYTDTLRTAEVDEWHLVEDKTKKALGQKLDGAIGEGTILLQTSKDRKNWVDVSTTDAETGHIRNAFADVPVREEAIYTTTEMQQNNGCYYRVTVIYKLGRRVKSSKIPVVNLDQYEYKKKAEVYELYFRSFTKLCVVSSSLA